MFKIDCSVNNIRIPAFQRIVNTILYWFNIENAFSVFLFVNKNILLQ